MLTLLLLGLNRTVKGTRNCLKMFLDFDEVGHVSIFFLDEMRLDGMGLADTPHQN